jgi:methionyl-tRNA formyltransferase
MNIVFAGTPEFAVPSLQILIDNGFKPVAVISSEDMPARRGKGFVSTPVKALAVENGIPVLQPENLKSDDFYEALSAYKPDILVVVAFKILPPRIFELPTLGAFNLHASLLPKYRGAAPINRAIMAGETQSGVSTFFLQRKVDTGNIILQKTIDIQPNDTAGMLHDALMHIGANAVLETVEQIAENRFTLQPQDNTLATPAPKIFKEDCQINWHQPAQKVHDFIRGLSPFPAAWTSLKQVQFKIIEAQIASEIKIAPAQIYQQDKQLFVGCKNGAIEVLSLQQEGRKRLTTAAFLQGFQFEPEAIWDDMLSTSAAK